MKAVARIPEGFRGAGDNNLTQPGLEAVIAKAIAVGRREGKRKLNLLSKKAANMYYPVGRAELYLNVNPSTELCKMLIESNLSEPSWRFTVRDGVLRLDSMRLSLSQNRDIEAITRTATLNHLKAELSIGGFVETYVD